MGIGMARRLLGAGFRLSVYNRSQANAAPHATETARIAASPADAARGATVAIGMVADDNASRSVWLGPHGALPALEPGAVIIESSTLTVEYVRELAAAASARGCTLLDAPVTGSKPHAHAGELNFLVGGPAGTLEQVRPVLAVMAKSIVHVGPTGSGALLKLVNNFLCAVQAVSTGEALALIEHSGLNRETCIDVLSAGAPGSPMLKTMFARMTGHDYVPANFRMALMAKDVAYAMKEGERSGVTLTTAAAALAAFKQAMAAGHGDEDFSSVVEPLREGHTTPATR
jgi:3-hydroxyisobutyrate dehydrogenase